MGGLQTRLQTGVVLPQGRHRLHETGDGGLRCLAGAGAILLGRHRGCACTGFTVGVLLRGTCHPGGGAGLTHLTSGLLELFLASRDSGHLLFDGTLDELRSRVPVERSLILDVLSDSGSSEAETEELVKKVTVPLDQVGGSMRLSELAASGTIVDASVTGGSLETIIATMFEQQ